MIAAQEQIPLGHASPTGWIKLANNHYADPKLLRGENNKPLTDIKFYEGVLAAQNLGLSPIDDIDYNLLVHNNPTQAKQMKKYAVWTSFLNDVEFNKNRSGYTAKHIARPEVYKKDGKYLIGGKEKKIKLPKRGFFKIEELMESETGLPEKTYGDKILGEPCAYLLIAEGKERPVTRGLWLLFEHWQFHAIARWGPFLSYPLVGVRVANDSEPTPIVMATAETIYAVEKISKRYGVYPAEVAAALCKHSL